MRRYTIVKVSEKDRITVKEGKAKSRWNLQESFIMSKGITFVFTKRQAYRLAQKLAKVSINLELP